MEPEDLSRRDLSNMSETRLTFGKYQNPFPKTDEEIKKEDCLPRERVRSAFPNCVMRTVVSLEV